MILYFLIYDDFYLSRLSQASLSGRSSSWVSCDSPGLKGPKGHGHYYLLKVFIYPYINSFIYSILINFCVPDIPLGARCRDEQTRSQASSENKCEHINGRKAHQ